MRGTCEECQQPDRLVGPFRAGERRYTRVCGGYKVRITLARPGAKERLATAEAQAMGHSAP